MVLFFLPHAGGSAKSYSSFKRFLPKDLTVVPMELSGRFTRSDEPMLTDVSSCVSDLINKYGIILESEEYAVFGHSMGTLLTCELIRQAKKNGFNAPKHVFLSGRCAPDEDIKCFGNSDTASDEEIAEFFSAHSLSSAPPIADVELQKKLNAVLGTDVRMADSFSLTPDDICFGCDITVMYGTEDFLLKNVDISGWKRFTYGECSVVPFSGDHFYYAQHKQEICEIIKDKLGI